MPIAVLPPVFARLAGMPGPDGGSLATAVTVAAATAINRVRGTIVSEVEAARL
jgi:hypothetical protein